MKETLEGFHALLARLEGNQPARLRLARRMAAAGFEADAREIAEGVLADRSAGAEACVLARRILANSIPAWHFALVRDAARNDAYEAAIKRAIRPGSRVLEIGAGTGLLAMMAARAGAASVVTCEANPAIAAMTQRIVALNGYADRIRTIAKHSTDLVPCEDLEPADVLVSEIFSNNLFAEHAITAINDARLRLLTPNARIVPATVSARVALAEGPEPKLMGTESGFDLSPFNGFYPTQTVVAVGSPELHLRSNPADIFTVDFEGHLRARPERACVEVVATGGKVNGVVQWLAMEMDREGQFENRPSPGSRSCWGAVFHPLHSAIAPGAGDRITVCGAHDTVAFDLWVDGH